MLQQMKVLFAAGEALPYIATGGLGDVAGSLPQAEKESGCDARVVIPLYSDIPQQLKRQP
nr:Glyco_transf_5 [uncultured Clostridium sp.]